MTGKKDGRLGSADRANDAPHEAAEASSPSGSVSTGADRAEIDAWLTENCGKGIPYADAVDLKTALHGLAYILRQVESTNSYKVFIGQCGPAMTALRWTLDHLARQAIEPVPADVARLVVAAREVAFSGLFEVATFNDPIALTAMRDLDQASEAFASRVPWGDEPEAETPTKPIGEAS